MLTRLPSESINETYQPTPGISTGSPNTFPPAALLLIYVHEHHLQQLQLMVLEPVSQPDL
jgi:hypothetical protein